MLTVPESIRLPSVATLGFKLAKAMDMKSFCRLFVVLFLLLGGTQSSGVTVIQDGFEDYSGVWDGLGIGSPNIGHSFTAVQDDASDLGSSAHASSGGASILIQRYNADPQESILKCNLYQEDSDLVEVVGAATIEFAFYKIYANDSGAYGQVQVFDGGVELFRILFQDNGSIDYYNGSTHVDTGLVYPLDQYVGVQVDVDWVAQSFTVMVDGNSTGGSTGVAFLNSSVGMESVWFGAGPNAQFRIDDLKIEVPDSVTFFWDGFDDASSIWDGLSIGTPDIGESFAAIQDDTSDIGISQNTKSGIGALLLQRFNADPHNSTLQCNMYQEDSDLVEAMQRATIDVAVYKIFANDSRASAFIQAHTGLDRLFTVLFEDDGDVSYYDGSVYVDTDLDYTLDQYVELTISLDFAGDSLAVSVDGDTTAGSIAIPFLVAAETIDSISLGVGKNGQSRFDDLGISTGPASNHSMILAFTSVDVPTLKARTESQEFDAIWQGILAQANAYCDPLSSEYADPTNIINPEFEAAWIKSRSGLYGSELTRWMESIAFAYQMTGGRNYAEHGAELLVAMADEFPVTHTYMQEGFEAGIGNMMRGMALGYDWLADQMTETQKNAFLGVAADYVQWTVDELDNTIWWGPYHNYMGVVAGAGGSLALTIRRDNANVPGWVSDLTDDIDRWFDYGFDLQGSYCEGIGYLQYGMSNATLFADGLRRYNGVDLMEHPAMQNITHFLAMEKLPDSYMFDARNDSRYEQGLVEPFVLKLANDNNDGLGRWLWEESGNKDFFLAIAWASDVPAESPAEASEPLAEHFTGRGLCVWRTGWDVDDIMFSVEAGPYYDMTSSSLTHDQADEGHFNMYGLGYRWANDSGYGNGTDVDSACQTVAHSCILVDRETAAPDRIGQAISDGGRGTSGTLLDYSNNSQYGYALADATDAYLTNDVGSPGAVVDHALRHTVFMRDQYSGTPYAVVLDDIRKDTSNHVYTWQLLSDPDVDVLIDDVQDGKIILEPMAHYIDTTDDGGGTGEVTWQVSITTPGNYYLWGRSRAAGEQLSGSDSFYVQVDNGGTVDWHFTYDKYYPEKWRWFRITDGAEKNEVVYNLDAGIHTIRVTTREAGAQLSRMVLTDDASAEPLFRPFGNNEFLLDAKEADVTSPMTREGVDTARMSVWLDGSANIAYSLSHRYGRSSLADYTPLVRADVNATNPQFIAVLVPQLIDQYEPDVTFSDIGDSRQVRIVWPSHTDVIDWSRNGDDMDNLTVVPGEPEFQADLNFDGKVNMVDFGILATRINSGSGGIGDLVLMITEWMDTSSSQGE